MMDSPLASVAAPVPVAGAAKASAEADALLRAATDLARDELQQVSAVIRRHLDSDIALIRALGAYIVQAGGKRLRPLMLLLSAKVGDGDNHRDDADRRDDKPHNAVAAAVVLAAVIEFIHTATLLHDDVVDASEMRRGRATANHVWGNQASVLVGDFLYSRAFEMMLETDNMEVMRILAATTNAIAEGEVMQLMNARAAHTTEAAYFDTIGRKTAKLFESAARLGGVAGGRPAAECDALATFGLHFGVAFQLVDDILDYAADFADTGKNAGDDLAEGKLTLPLIVALQRAGGEQRAALRRAVEGGARERVGEVLGIVESTGALDYTIRCAKRESAAAIDALAGIPDSRYKTALAGLAKFATMRGH